MIVSLVVSNNRVEGGGEDRNRKSEGLSKFSQEVSECMKFWCGLQNCGSDFHNGP